ncbi:D-alanine--D-alanine ligase family protein [Blochmannia endosymbiont of Camponotus (Colobopsis) obliquus]|uniref:D-alanine--D-alanine ligase family protein n=1 Tax=Blochmannia endosymbiont of Camponotus (Colobopsis) obliquus TaxID=1505597 RepID=UPI00061A7766|nr:D-alanine--D-alanine ligase family protein [Blochmannia endosymbiont of Camponotus (Colobopsis) obliquus]AKC60626.1 D-alanine--D-alanine ligase A [Blochmannia endosymbiont of Camponotus (Colobopsis) obliquus]
MSKLRVGIIFGGSSLEHEVSVLSAINIINFIDKDCFEVIVIMIDKSSKWYVSDLSCFLQDNKKYSVNTFCSYIKKHGCNNIFLSLQDCPYRFMYMDNLLSFLKIDLIFPIVHGSIGEDGTLQGLLQISKIPFIGSHVLGSVISMNKDISKCLLRNAGLKVTSYEILTYKDYCINGVNFEYFVSSLGLPLFIKPVNQGSSLGVSKVFNKSDFYRALKLAFEFSYKILVESAIIGREIECAVLGNEELQISLCGEIIHNDVYYTYRSKYVDTQGVQLIIPAKISNIITSKIRCISLKAFKVLNCLGMARVDIFLTQSNQIIINEVNTLPGFTSDSMYPKLWQASGLNCTALITKLIELAMNLHRDDVKFR